MARLVPALARGLDILELVHQRGPLSAPEITRELRLPRTTVHELVKTLESRGYLKTEGDGYRVTLGVRLFELGIAYESGLDLAQVAKASAVGVAESCGDAVHVAVLDGTDVVYIIRVEGRHAVQMVSGVGVRLPAHLTAVGKALLAHQSQADIDKLYPPGAKLSVMTSASLKTSEELRAALERVRREGLAWDACESNVDVNCVAAAITDRTGATVAAISISVPAYRWTEERGRELAELVMQSAAEVSAQLGYFRR